jgi:hypothetical protein
MCGKGEREGAFPQKTVREKKNLLNILYISVARFHGLR